MTKHIILSFLTVVLIISGCGHKSPENQIKANMPISLHSTSAGMEYFYSKAQGGFELATGIPYSELACKDCHVEADDCLACHVIEGHNNYIKPVDDTCLKCHSRQKKEFSKYTDVHIDKNMTCANCHNAMDIHGDTVQFISMLEPGGIKADCNNCHRADQVHGRLEEWEIHLSKFDCAVCHTRVSTTCYNCHFDT